MTKSSRFLAGAMLVPVLMAARPFADVKPHVIDKNHSQINFIADSRLLSAHGFFGKWDADVKLDATNWSASTVSISIDATSLNTRVDMRDNHLRSPDFFDVAKFPTITFKSVSVTKVSEGKLDIAGDLTIRGVTKRIVVPATAVFYEKGAGRFRGQFAINRKDYGVAFDSAVNPIENEVQVQWDMAISEPKPAAAK
ncbi:YceI family protein [Gemmatimonas sp.]|uniref:YceI family protein n=1 Tax=Gemmatimonas sp. TaxID=1962908 RepID=UPI00286E6537|nr:YceI family protein [Gemmatimonas sp.]